MCEYTSAIPPTRIADAYDAYPPVVSVVGQPEQRPFPPFCPSFVFSSSVPDVLPWQVLSFDATSKPQSREAAMCTQICRLIEKTDSSTDEMVARFFQGIHRRIPILSQARFQDNVRHSTNHWRADFSILLLAICLVTYRKSFPSSPIDTESLYLATKMLFTQVQSLVPLSTSLIQAGVLISFFEYAHRLPDVAFISLGLCARMASAVDLDAADSSSSGTGVEEERNTWWAIVILERYVDICHDPLPPAYSSSVVSL